MRAAPPLRSQENKNETLRWKTRKRLSFIFVFVSGAFLFVFQPKCGRSGPVPTAPTSVSNGDAKIDWGHVTLLLLHIVSFVSICFCFFLCVQRRHSQQAAFANCTLAGCTVAPLWLDGGIAASYTLVLERGKFANANFSPAIGCIQITQIKFFIVYVELGMSFGKIRATTILGKGLKIYSAIRHR